MANPNGVLLVPIGFRSDGSPHALELDNSDRLKVLIDSVTGSVIVTQSDPANLFTGIHAYDGATWRKVKSDANGRLSIDVNSVPAPLSSLTLDEDNKLIVSDVPHGIFDLSTVTSIAKTNSANNNTVIIHTVTTAKTLYLTSVFLTVYNGGAAAASGYIKVRDTSDVDQYYWVISVNVNGTNATSLNFFPPIPVPAGYDVVVTSGLASLFAFATFTGYEK